MVYITADDLARRARLQAAIDKRDAERERNALIKHDPGCAVHLDSDRKCNCGADGMRNINLLP